MGIQINGQTDVISAADGSLTVSGADLPNLTQVVVSGVSTLSGGVNASQGADSARLRVTGITTLGQTTTIGLSNAGVSTLSGGVNASQGADLARLRVTGITTLGQTNTTGLSNAGVSTLGNATASTLNVSGFSTFSGGASVTSGGFNVTGVVTATSFSGDGTNLTNTGSTLSAASGSQRVVVTSQTSGTMTASATDAALTFTQSTGTLNSTNLVVTGNASIGGTVTYMDVTNVDSVGIITAQVGLQVLANGINVTGVCTVGVITGATSVQATDFYGNGANLTGISLGITTEQASPNNTIVFLNLAKQDHKITASGITTISCSGGTEGESHTLRIVNSGIATVGFSTFFLFPSGSSPSLPTTSGAIHLISFTVHRAGTSGIGTQLLAGASLNFS